MHESTDNMFNDLCDLFSPPLHLTHTFFFFTPLKLNRCLSNSLKVQWSSVSGNDTSVGMFTGNIPSSLNRNIIDIYTNTECPKWMSSLVYVSESSLIILLIAARSVPAPGGHAWVKKLIIKIEILILTYSETEKKRFTQLIMTGFHN